MPAANGATFPEAQPVDAGGVEGALGGFGPESQAAGLDARRGTGGGAPGCPGHRVLLAPQVEATFGQTGPHFGGRDAEKGGQLAQRHLVEPGFGDGDFVDRGTLLGGRRERGTGRGSVPLRGGPGRVATPGAVERRWVFGIAPEVARGELGGGPAFGDHEGAVGPALPARVVLHQQVAAGRRAGGGAIEELVTAALGCVDQRQQRLGIEPQGFFPFEPEEVEGQSAGFGRRPPLEQPAFGRALGDEGADQRRGRGVGVDGQFTQLAQRGEGPALAAIAGFVDVGGAGAIARGKSAIGQNVDRRHRGDVDQVDQGGSGTGADTAGIPGDIPRAADGRLSDQGALVGEGQTGINHGAAGHP